MATIIIIAAVIAMLARQRDTGQSHVLLAAVSGPDTSLSLAVREALRAELEQSEDVHVLSDVVTARTLACRPARWWTRRARWKWRNAAASRSSSPHRCSRWAPVCRSWRA
jgi:hypothetical protein